MPYFRDAELHPRVLLFGAAVSLLAVVVFSVTPVLRLSLSNLREDLAEGGRGSAGTLWKRFGSNLVAAELAIAMVLLASAGLLGKSLYRIFRDSNSTREPGHLRSRHAPATKNRSFGCFPRLVEPHSACRVEPVAHTSDLPITCTVPMDFRSWGIRGNGEGRRGRARHTSADYAFTPKQTIAEAAVAGLTGAANGFSRRRSSGRISAMRSCPSRLRR
jgi:hypothetical protein